MARNDNIMLKGEVTDSLKGSWFKVKCDNGHTIDAKISGKLHHYKIKVMVGDIVTVSISPYDLTHGQITYRETKNVRK